MRYGLSLDTTYDNPRTLVQMAQEAEAAGWEGFFIWDTVLFMPDGVPVCDPWVTLAAIAVSTQRLRFGPLVTPLARRRPWQVAREAVSLDRLSDGRLILGVGLGEPLGPDFEMFGESTDAKVRARRLDEGLDILSGLWTGEPFQYEGEHFHLQTMRFLPRPVQRPRIPVWIGGYWPHPAPMRRAARWDGVCALKPGGNLDPDETRAMVAFIQAHRTTAAPFDVTAWGRTPGDDPQRWAEAGATWWLEIMDPWRFGWQEDGPYPLEAMRDRIRQGPPRP